MSRQIWRLLWRWSKNLWLIAVHVGAVLGMGFVLLIATTPDSAVGETPWVPSLLWATFLQIAPRVGMPVAFLIAMAVPWWVKEKIE